MEKAHTKSAFNKFMKASSQSAVSSSWSSNSTNSLTATRTTKDEPKERSSGKYSKGTPKSPTKENTKPLEFTLHTQQRAVRRAMFNYSVATKLYLEELQKKRVEKLQKMIEEEEVKLLRKEMVPRAQLMPHFDRPFFPQRSNRPLTVPRESSVRSKCWSRIPESGLCCPFKNGHALNLKPIK